MNWLKARLSEPSTWNGLAVIVGIGSQLTTHPQYQTALAGLAGVFASLGVAKSEKGAQ